MRMTEHFAQGKRVAQILFKRSRTDALEHRQLRIEMVENLGVGQAKLTDYEGAKLKGSDEGALKSSATSA